MSADTRLAVLVSVGLHLLLVGAALLMMLPSYERQPQDERNVRLMQVRTGFPNAVPGDVFRGRGSEQGQPQPPRTVQHELSVESGVTELEARPRVVQDVNSSPQLRDDEDAIAPAAAQADTASARTASAQAAAPAGDDYLSRLEQRLAQQGSAQDTGNQAVEGEVLVYDANDAEVSRGVRHRVIPKYPAGEQLVGQVHVRIDITPDGRVENAMLLRKLSSAFDAASMEAAAGWLFEPAPETAHHYAVIKFRYVLE